jgi:vitamin B12 transporter
VVPLLCVRLLSLSLILAAPPTSITGVVVDADGRPVPRAVVQAIGADGASVNTLSESDGSFRIADAPASCRIEAMLPGFEKTSAACDAAPLRLTLRIAPVAEHIVVSATRTEAPAGQVAASVTVFDETELGRKQQPLLADLLRDAPGATVVSTGGLGSVTSLFVRAGESNYTKVLLDGVPLNEPGGAFNLSNITTDNLERVEFVRGANSALYGSDAMTGVIQLFTRRGRSARPQGQFRVEGGTFGTVRGSADAAGKAGRFDYSGDVSGLTTDNDVPNNRFRNATFSGAIGASLGHGATLRLVGRSERGKTGTPGQTLFGRPDLDAFYQRHDQVWGISYDPSTGALHQRASYGLAVSHQASTNLHLDPPYTPSFEGRTAPFEFSDFAFDSRSNLRRHSAGYQIDDTITTAAAGTHVETALVDWEGERASLDDALNGGSVPASRNNVGLTLQHQALWSRVFVTAGVRFQHNASFGSATAPRVAAAWYARQSDGAAGTTRLHASAGKGIKEPTILQSFSPNPFFLGNPDLAPERTTAYDAGIEQRLAHDRVRLDLTWFANRYRDIIATRTISFTPYTSQYFNIGLTRARGAELTGDVVLVSGFRTRAGYTFTDSEILESTSSSAVFEAGNWAFRRPRHSGYAGLSWSGGRASIDLSGSFVGRRVDSDFSSLVPAIVENSRYALWDLRGSLTVTRAIALTAAIDNLTDSDHMDPLGYAVLGRAVRVGIRTKW